MPKTNTHHGVTLCGNSDPTALHFASKPNRVDVVTCVKCLEILRRETDDSLNTLAARLTVLRFEAIVGEHCNCGKQDDAVWYHHGEDCAAIAMIEND